jgi:hypothetical protein
MRMLLGRTALPTLALLLASCSAAAPTPVATLESITPGLSLAEWSAPIGLGVVNATDLQVSLVVNGTVIKTFAPGDADKEIYVNALPLCPGLSRRGHLRGGSWRR